MSRSISMCFIFYSISPHKCIFTHSGRSTEDEKHYIFPISLNSAFGFATWQKFKAELLRSIDHRTTGNDTTSAQLLGIRPTLKRCVCVVRLKNKQHHQQQKKHNRCNIAIKPGCWSVCVHLSIHTVLYLANHTQGKLINSWGILIGIQPRKCLFNPPRVILFLSRSNPTLSPSLWLSLSLLSLSDPPWWFQCLRIGWLIPALDGWQTSSLHTGVQQGLHSARTLWWITGLLMHTVERVCVKKRKKKAEDGMRREEARLKLHWEREDSREKRLRAGE